ncbi:MAG: tetratricopeptide repeat protein [Candidatus Marinimicrobia bacterium]|nr:tetratricopeptide repeat protein [Candidatus Neomarinimicrobiota bacterium]MBL7046199.1 tetratricopeptide repeat protein [Candidatus Neomarinimicrobiota bacterium]
MKNSSFIDRSILICFIALVVAVPLAYSSKVTDITQYPKFLVLTIIVSILTVLWLIKFIAQKKIPSFSTPLALPILFFLIINIVSLNAAVNVYASLFPLAQLFILSILFFILFNNLSQKGIYLILGSWALVGAIAAVIGIGQYLGLGFYWIPSVANPSSTFANKNLAAMYIILTIPVGLFLFIMSRKIINQILWGFVNIQLIVYLIYTRTMGAWVGFSGAIVVTFIILLLIRKHRTQQFSEIKRILVRKEKLFIALACVVVIVSMSLLKPNIKVPSNVSTGIIYEISSLLEGGGSSMEARLGFWRASLDIFIDNLNWLTGVGLNNYQFHYPAYAQGHLISFTRIVGRPHNDFLWILIETGIIGFGIYIWLLLTAAYMVLIILKNTTDAKIVLLTVFLTTSLLAILGHAMFSFPKERIAISMLFWMILAFLTYIYKLLPSIASRNSLNPVHFNYIGSEKLTFRLGVSTLIGFAIISTVSVELGRRHLVSDHHFKQAYFYFEREVYPGAIQELNRAEEFWFNSWKTSYLLGLAYLRSQNHPRAVNAFKRCLTYSPYFFNAHYNLGVTYFKSNNFREAIKHFAFTILINPDFAKGYYNLGISWHRAGNVSEAEKNYRLSIALDSTQARPHNNLGSILMEKKDYGEALSHFHKALNIDPDSPEALRNLDSTLAKMNHP